MKKRLPVLLLVIACWSMHATGQTTEKEKPAAYFRARLSDLTTWDQASSIDQLVRSKPGIVMTRTDQYSDTFLAFYHADGTVSTADFEAWIASLGFEVLCSVTGLEGEVIKELPTRCGSGNDLDTNTHKR